MFIALVRAKKKKNNKKNPKHRKGSQLWAEEILAYFADYLTF